MVIIPTTWQASTAYVASVGAYVQPTDINATGLLYRVTIGGTTSGTEPNWPRTLGLTVVDGSVTWTCAALAPLISRKDLEDAWGPALVIRFFDKNQDGHADGNVVARICWDATSFIQGLIGRVYDFPMSNPPPNELIRIAIDVAEAYAAKRTPSVARRPWKELLDQARDELVDIRTGLAALDIPPTQNTVNAPPPAKPTPKNVGAIVLDNSVRMVVDGPMGRVNNTLL